MKRLFQNLDGYQNTTSEVYFLAFNASGYDNTSMGVLAS